MGAAAGAALGPLGAIGGAVIGAVAGAAASGLAVAAVDRIDNDDTVSGMGDGVTSADVEDQLDDEADEDLLVEDEEVAVAHTSSRSPDMAAGSGYATPMGSGSPWPTVTPAEPAKQLGNDRGEPERGLDPGNDVPGIPDGRARCRRHAGHARDHREGVGT